MDPTKLSALSGAYIVSAVTHANPVLLPVAASGLVYSIRKEEDKKAALIRAG
jgi:zinc transporter ZupT